MRISLESLDGRHFVLELPQDDNPEQKNVISIQHAANLRGVYAQDDRMIALDGIKADELVAEAVWHLAAGPLKVSGPIRAGAIAVDIHIPRGEGAGPTAGHAELASLTVPAFSLPVGEASAPTQIGAQLALRGLTAANPSEPNEWHILIAEAEAARVSVSKVGLTVGIERFVGERVAADLAGGTTTIRLGTAALSGLGLDLPTLGLRVAQIRLKDVRFETGPSTMAVEVGEAELSGVTVRVGAGEGEHHVRTAGAIRVRGLRFADGNVAVQRLEVEDAEIAALLAGPQTEAHAPERKPESDSGGFTMPDLKALDRLHGTLHADIDVDVKIPLIRHIVAKYKLRNDVKDGTVDFKQLEDGLSFLEDALIDFGVKKNALVVEVKGVKKTLVAWPLDAEGLKLAEQQNRVKIRTLAQPDLPKSEPDSEPAPESTKESSVGLKRVDVDNVDIELGLGGGGKLALPQGTVLLGTRQAPALEQLTVKGDLAFAPGRATEPKTLQITVRGLHVGLEAFAVGAAQLSVGTAVLGELRDTTLTMAGFTPTKLVASARGLVLESVEYRNPPGARA